MVIYVLFLSKLCVTSIQSKLSSIPDHSVGGLWRPLDSSLSPHIQVVRSNQLEHGIILNRPVPFSNKIIPVDQLRQEDLHLLQRKVKPNTHALPHRKRDICGLVSALHFRRIPAVRVESSRVIPQLRVIVDVVKGRNND